MPTVTDCCNILLIVVAFVLLMSLIPKCVVMLRQVSNDSVLESRDKFDLATQKGKHVVLFLDVENCYYSKKFVGKDGKENINHWQKIQKDATIDEKIHFHTVECNMRKAGGWEHELKVDGKKAVAGYPTSLYVDNGRIVGTIVGAVPHDQFVKRLNEMMMSAK